MSDLETLFLPPVEGCVVAVLYCLMERVRQRNRVLNAGVHALSSCRTMDVRGVTREQHTAATQRFRDSMLQAKSGRPRHTPNRNRAVLRPTLVENRGHVL